MKTFVALIVMLIGAAGAEQVHAIQFEKVTGAFVGTVLQSGTVDGVSTTIQRPLSKTWMLQVFGHTEVAPGHAFYFYDNVNGRYVLADTTATTIYGTILQFPGASNVTWPDAKHHSDVFGDTLTMFNGLVSGTEQDSDTPTISKGRFIMTGSINSTPTIIYGSYLVRF